MYLSGIKRSTEDVDLWLEPTNKNKNKLLRVFLEMDYTKEELAPIEARNFEDYFVFSALGHMDFLTILHPSLPFDLCFAQSHTHHLGNGAVCHFLHMHHLRQSKILSKREIDLRDVVLIDDFLKSTGSK